MILVVQTNIPGELHVWRADMRGEVLLHKQKKIVPGGAEGLLSLINGTLKGPEKHGAGVKGIILVTGPGPFTPVRVGLSVVNTLAVAWNLPAIGIVSENVLSSAQIIGAAKKIQKKKSAKPLRPFYGREPNISKPALRRVGLNRGRIAVK